MRIQVNKNNVYVSLSDSFTMAHTVVHATWWHSFTLGPAINLPNILLLADPTFVMVSSQHEESRSPCSSYHTSTSARSPGAHFKVSWGHQSWLSARIFTHVHAWKRLDFRKSVSVPGLVWCWSYSDKLWAGPPKCILNTGSASKITWRLIFRLSHLSNNTSINSQFNSIPVFWCSLWMNLHQQIMLRPLEDEPFHPVLTSCILFPSLASSGVAPLRCALAPLSPSSFKQLAALLAGSRTVLMKWVCLMERKRFTEYAVILSRALAQGMLPPHFQHSHTPIKGFDCTASEDDQRAERERMKDE